MQPKPIDDDLSIIELTFRLIDRVFGDRYQCREVADEAISDLNVRFDEHQVGFQYADGILLRRDSQFIHKEAVIPALIVLNQALYGTAEHEFLSAHEHYRHGKMAEALVDACKAFESTMKIICEKRKWKFDPSKPASHLIQMCLENGLVPSYWQTQFTSLKSLLEASIPTARNKQGGHGAGTLPPHDPPRELVAYVLHMTASTILFLVEAERTLE